MPITVRAARADDAPTLARLNAFVHGLHVAERPEIFKVTRADEVERWFVGRLEDKNSAVFIAEHGGESVGYVLAIFCERAENAFVKPLSWCELDQIAVDPRRRKSGVARSLCQMVLQEAARRGTTSIEANTWWFNAAARSTFKKLGFQEKFIRFERR